MPASGQPNKIPISDLEAPADDDDRELSILVATWNVGNQMPHPQELQHWLPQGGGRFDLVVIGTQENSFRRSTVTEHGPPDESDLQITTEYTDSSGVESPQERGKHPWDAMCERRLGSAWCVVAHVVMMQMRLRIYARKALAPSIRHVERSRAATGVAGMPNKGGLVVRLTVGRTTFAFCSCHLEAHEGSDHLHRRNAMAHRVLLKWMANNRKIGGASRCRGQLLDAAHATDHIVWLGDLNYRVDLGLVGLSTSDHAAHHAAVSDMIERRDWSQLLAADQLRDAQRRGNAFVGFAEGDMGFAPTFKVTRCPGVVYTQQRIPSYCDRVLWKSMPPCKMRLRLQSLRSIEEVSTSDHKPAVAALTAAPSPKLDRTPDVRATIKCLNLKVENVMAADARGSSDVQCLFFINPEGLMWNERPASCYTSAADAQSKPLRGQHGRLRAPRTTVICNVQSGPSTRQADDAAPEMCVPRDLRRHRLRRNIGINTGTLRRKQGQLAEWKDHQTPLIQLCTPLAQLNDASLLIVVVDYDPLTTSELIGVVTVPLEVPTAFPVRRSFQRSGSLVQRVAKSIRGSARTAEGDGGYTIDVNEPIVFLHSIHRTGRLSCTLHIRRPEADAGFVGRLFTRFQTCHTHARKLELEGDFLGAANELEKACRSFRHLKEERVADAELVRSRVTDLTRLAEMIWRYKIVEQGESPRDAAIEKLERAQQLIEAHYSSCTNVGMPKKSRITLLRSPKKQMNASFKIDWASELSAVLQGLCATQIIFDANKEDFVEQAVTLQLKEAIALRQEAGLHLEVAESTHTLGEMLFKRGNYDEAELVFRRGLELRQAIPCNVESERMCKIQSGVAQSLISLGNLATMRGNLSCDQSHAAHYAEARAFFEAARVAYIKGGMSEEHPKIAWVAKGLGMVHEREGNVDKALNAYEHAIHLWRRLQSMDKSKEMFKKELLDAEKRCVALRRNGCRQPQHSSSLKPCSQQNAEISSTTMQETPPESPAAKAVLGTCCISSKEAVPVHKSPSRYPLGPYVVIENCKLTEGARLDSKETATALAPGSCIEIVATLIEEGVVRGLTSRGGYVTLFDLNSKYGDSGTAINKNDIPRQKENCGTQVMINATPIPLGIYKIIHGALTVTSGISSSSSCLRKLELNSMVEIVETHIEKRSIVESHVRGRFRATNADRVGVDHDTSSNINDGGWITMLEVHGPRMKMYVRPKQLKPER